MTLQKLLYYSDFILAPLAAFVFAWEGEGSWFGFIGGMIAWTVLEYGLHRVAHVLKLAEHAKHHRKPRTDSSPSIFLIVPIAGLAWWLGSGLFASGLLVQYSAFISLHWSFHHWTYRAHHPFYRAKRRHDEHHAGRETNFGVTSTMWDRLSGTNDKRN